MESIYIVGASGAAKEICLLVQQINAIEKKYLFKGFIDANPTEKILKIGSVTYSVFNENDFLKSTTEKTNIVFAFGEPKELERITKNYKDKSNFNFPNIIHPNTILNESISLGEGNIICEASVLTTDIKIGSFNYINRGAHIGHDVKINSYNVINPCAVVSGGVSIENCNLIGTHATILQYLSIGSKNKIGAGAVLTKPVKNNTTMIGIPAKSIKNE